MINISDPYTQAFILSLTVSVLAITLVGILIHKTIKNRKSLQKTTLKANSLVVARFIQVVLICGIIWFVAWAHIYEVLVWNKPFIQTFYTSFKNVLSYILLSITIIYIEYSIHRYKQLSALTQRKLPRPIFKTTPEKLLETIQQLQSEKEAMKLQLWRYKRKPSGLAGYILTIVGALALISSLITSSSILAFIGLGLTFWGILLLYIKPTKYVRASLLESTALSSLEAINQIITNLNYKGKAIYLPPKYLKTPKGGTVFIPSKKEFSIPPAEEIAQENVFLENPQGMCLTPPGLDLANLYEKELGKDFADVDLSYLQNNLPKLLIDDLEIAEDLEISTEDNMIKMRTTESIYKKSSSICNSMGCPLCSSIAIAISRATRKPVIIEKTSVSESDKIAETYYRILEK